MNDCSSCCPVETEGGAINRAGSYHAIQGSLTYYSWRQQAGLVVPLQEPLALQGPFAKLH
jgi:hypothetical protein